MNSKIFIKGSTLDILNRFEQYSAEEKLSQRPNCVETVDSFCWTIA